MFETVLFMFDKLNYGSLTQTGWFLRVTAKIGLMVSPKRNIILIENIVSDTTDKKTNKF